MQTSGPATRPRRPTRELPSLPIASSPVQTDHEPDSPQADSQDLLFLTPPSSPTLQHPLVESPTEEEPPPHRPNGKLAQPSVSKSKQEDYHTLTPVRAHYLKKQLIQLECRAELSALVNAPTNNISTFSYLGPPFSPPPKDGPRLDLPFLRHIFRHFVLSFPFLAAAPKNFFPDKLQPFMASMLSRNLSATSALDLGAEKAEEDARFKLLGKLQRNFAMILTTGTKLSEPEEVVRLTQADLSRLETLAAKRAAREKKINDVFEINVVCVRTVVERGRVRSRAHEEFIIRTRRTGFQDVYVSRRYGDFKTLAIELRKAHPTENVPPPPPKDRSYVNVAVPSGPSSTASTPPVSPYGASMSRSPTKAGRQYAAMPGVYELEMSQSNRSHDSVQSPMSPPGSFPVAQASPSYGGSQYASRLAREKNRLTLRSYLHVLLGSMKLGSSPVLKSFLLADPTKLTEEEMADARHREELDRLREDGRKKFSQEIKERVDGLRGAMRSVKGELFAKDGLTQVFSVIKHNPDVRNLPENYQAVVEWARISLASTVFHHFVASDNASESFAGLKRIHGLMPYFMLKAALKISNPVAMIRGVLDLFLAQPFGGRSLLQRMFTGSLVEEVRALEGDIEAVKAKVDDPMMCEKVKVFVNAPKEIQAIYKADAAAEDIHVLTVILRSGDVPALSRIQMQRVMRAHHAHREYTKYTETLADSDDDDGPQNDDAWLYEDLNLLGKLYSRLRDREQLIALIFEGTTSELLKDIITIFYSPLAQVYRAASIADSLGDLQNFMNDLIRTVEQTEELSQEDPSKTVQIFIDLIQRHEQSFYSFVHKVHSKGEGLFDSLMRWIELYLDLMREGLGQPISLEFLLPHTGQERQDILREVDEVARYHYKLKLAHEAKLRRRFGRTQGTSSRGDAEAEDEAAAALVNDVVQDMTFGELMKGEADDYAAEVSDEESAFSANEEDGDDESDDEDGSSSSGGSSGSGSESDSSEGSDTEGDEPLSPRQTTPLARSRTLGHSPLSPSHRPPPSPHHAHNQSLQVSHPPSILPRPHRSMSIPASKALPSLPSSSSKPLPPSPMSQQRAAEARRHGRPPSPKKKRKKPEGPKPPELKHIPQVLPLFVEVIDKIAHVVGGDAIARGCARVLGIQDLIEEWKPARTSTKCDRDRGPPARGPDISHGCAMVGYTDHSTHSRFTLTPLRKWPLGMDIVGRFIVSKSGHVSYGDRHGYEDWVL
ncbi:hypothetical protein NLI96_g5579 [Meripilus lineatus]|uniref:PX domain-containing protein n=1 Tax=Meripilus lineatus TaxID=2056292 RepID=A0AAD5YDS3_9APHY|nr:hypothetical protein NLI96_g5579 [Physisporinus lineatus]